MQPPAIYPPRLHLSLAAARFRGPGGTALELVLDLSPELELELDL